MISILYCIHVDFSSSVYKKIIPDATTPIFQKVGAVTQTLIFYLKHKNFSWCRVNHDDILISRYSYSFVCHCFQLKSHKV